VTKITNYLLELSGHTVTKLTTIG